jgi:hypothetical protein
MPLPPKIASALLSLVAGASLLLSACSSSTPQDMNKGTDSGVGWIPPDTGAGPDLAPDALEVSADLAPIADGGAVLDASLDEGR